MGRTAPVLRRSYRSRRSVCQNREIQSSLKFALPLPLKRLFSAGPVPVSNDSVPPRGDILVTEARMTYDPARMGRYSVTDDQRIIRTSISSHCQDDHHETRRALVEEWDMKQHQNSGENRRPRSNMEDSRIVKAPPSLHKICRRAQLKPNIRKFSEKGCSGFAKNFKLANPPKYGGYLLSSETNVGWCSFPLI